jgi:hypothetical protein
VTAALGRFLAVATGNFLGRYLPVMSTKRAGQVRYKLRVKSNANGWASMSNHPAKKRAKKFSAFDAHKHESRFAFKDTRCYVLSATTPCVVTYACARIRWLVRLWGGLYRFPVTEKQ